MGSKQSQRNHVSVSHGEVLKGRVPSANVRGRGFMDDDVKPTHSSRNDGGPHIKQHPMQHPMHHPDADHRHISMPEKYNDTGPHIKMGGHQHELHHPHTDVSEKHHKAMTKDHY